MPLAPFKFKPNRVWRVYRGGKMIDLMRRAENPSDGSFPEDWISSTVEANNPQRNLKTEGISIALIDNKEIPFDKLCQEYPEALFGREHAAKFGFSPGFLTKILDSAIRLPIQAHPDNETAKKLYHSDYGKTETWIVLDSRKINGEEPYLMLGFNENFDKEIFMEEALTGKMNKSLSMLHKHTVKPGDILLIKGGMPHAIGPGVFLIEIMEPTDLVTQPELYCGTQKLEDKERFGGLAPEKAMEVFNYKKSSKDEVWKSAYIKSSPIEKNAEGELSLLIDREKVKFFGAKKLELNGKYLYKNTDNCCATGIVCEGNVQIKTYDNFSLSLNRGDTFFLPFTINECAFHGNAQIILALPPTL
jgi:mannose-6-phosphate isomerase